MLINNAIIMLVLLPIIYARLLVCVIHHLPLKFPQQSFKVYFIIPDIQVR